MNERAWSTVISFPDQASAELTRGRFLAEGIPSRLASNADLPGLGFNFSVCVPSDLTHRARWILEQSKISEGELVYLATGKLSDDEASLDETS